MKPNRIGNVHSFLAAYVDHIQNQTLKEYVQYPRGLMVTGKKVYNEDPICSMYQSIKLICMGYVLSSQLLM